jgi:methylaspartate ammonia-lyase
LSNYANVQEWLALSRIEIDQARLLVMQVAWLLDQAEIDRAALNAKVAAIKVVAARLQVKVVDRAIQIFGAMGLSPDTPLAYFWTWGRALQIMDTDPLFHDARTIGKAASYSVIFIQWQSWRHESREPICRYRAASKLELLQASLLGVPCQPLQFWRPMQVSSALWSEQH